MTYHRRLQHAASAGAIVLAAAAVGAGLHGQLVGAALFGVGVLVLTEAALRQQRQHRRIVLEHGWARRRGAGERPRPLRPCCLLAERSYRRACSPRCTRTCDLTSEQFWAIVAHCDGP